MRGRAGKELLPWSGYDSELRSLLLVDQTCFYVDYNILRGGQKRKVMIYSLHQ